MNRLIVSILCCSILLTGCSLTTPQGTITLTYDKDNTSEDTVFSYGDKQIVIHTSDIKSYIDQLLSSVSLPEGVSSDSLKEFVYTNLESLEIDLSDVNEDDIPSIEASIKSSLEQQGVDTSELNIDLEEALDE